MKDPEIVKKSLREHLAFLYGDRHASDLHSSLLQRLDAFTRVHPELLSETPEDKLTEKDAVLITYPDMLQDSKLPPIKALSTFLERHVTDLINTVHILPFYPYSSDDGFAVIDYFEVNPEFGTWEDIRALGNRFKLMFDAVINHISSKSTWFQGFIAEEEPYQSYFKVVPLGVDLSMVFRPRESDLLTAVKTKNGEKLVWTTFSPDQIDLNYENPEVLFAILEVILKYVEMGASLLRLDAVTYLWMQEGSSSVNLPQTHRIIQFIRSVLDYVAPKVTLITETNIPHKDNITYFGDGKNEAQMVYNFALPLLTLHSFYCGDAVKLSKWASTLELPSKEVTFFNFLAGHDGIGILPVMNILTEQEIQHILDHAQMMTGEVSYKTDQDGALSPYEININYLDALRSGPEGGDPKILARRFLTSQAVMLALRGVPGIYFHSLVGSHGWLEGFHATGQKRSINREKLVMHQLEKELADHISLRQHIFTGYLELLEMRRSSSAFHPMGEQWILEFHPSVFAILRSAPQGDHLAICLHNVSSQSIVGRIDLPTEFHGFTNKWRDLFTVHQTWSGERFEVQLDPYQVRWLVPIDLGNR